MSRKGGVGGGCKHLTQHSASNPPTPPNLPLFQTPKLSTRRAQRGGTGSVFADNSIHNATSQQAENRF